MKSLRMPRNYNPPGKAVGMTRDLKPLGRAVRLEGSSRRRAGDGAGPSKGRNLSESMERNFGMPHPEGYRKALRLMKTAEQFKMPVLCFIDTAGAYPGIGAEERGQAEAIARKLEGNGRA